MGPNNGNQIPQKTVFQKFGGTIYLKIPKDRLEYFGIEHIKQEDTPNTVPAKFQAERGPHGEYGSFWNPEQEDGEQ